MDRCPVYRTQVMRNSKRHVVFFYKFGVNNDDCYKFSMKSRGSEGIVLSCSGCTDIAKGVNRKPQSTYKTNGFTFEGNPCEGHLPGCIPLNLPTLVHSLKLEQLDPDDIQEFITRKGQGRLLAGNKTAGSKRKSDEKANSIISPSSDENLLLKKPRSNGSNSLDGNSSAKTVPCHKTRESDDNFTMRAIKKEIGEFAQNSLLANTSGSPSIESPEDPSSSPRENIPAQRPLTIAEAIELNLDADFISPPRHISQPFEKRVSNNPSNNVATFDTRHTKGISSGSNLNNRQSTSGAVIHTDREAAEAAMAALERRKEQSRLGDIRRAAMMLYPQDDNSNVRSDICTENRAPPIGGRTSTPLNNNHPNKPMSVNGELAIVLSKCNDTNPKPCLIENKPCTDLAKRTAYGSREVVTIESDGSESVHFPVRRRICIAPPAVFKKIYDIFTFTIEELGVEIVNNTLIVKFERKMPKEDHIMVYRTILPSHVDQKTVQAGWEEGKLIITAANKLS